MISCGVALTAYDATHIRTLYWSYPLPTSMESIVSAYVRLKNQQALEDMREFRRQLLKPLRSTSSINPTHSRDSILEDIRVIENGLEQIQSHGCG